MQLYNPRYMYSLHAVVYTGLARYEHGLPPSDDMYMCTYQDIKTNVNASFITRKHGATTSTRLT